MIDPLRPSVGDALASWARRVRENREQVDRFREVPERADHYAPIASMFRVDPRRDDEPALAVLRSLVRPEDTWLDVGAGGGRYALPIALLAREVIAVDPSEGMLGELREGMAEHGISNVRVVPGRWPELPAEPVQADVALIAHVGYDIEAIGPFLDRLEASARRLCVAVLFYRRPTWVVDQLWPAVHGVPRAALPALPEFLTLLLARERVFEIRLAEGRMPTYESVDQALAFARLQTWVEPGGEKDRRLRATVAERLTERDGRYAYTWEPGLIGVVSWSPGRDRQPRENVVY
jgi:SAM-dependent methyltransferase